MAKAPPANNKETAPESEEQPPKKKGKLPLLIGLLVILVVAGGAGWYFFSKKSDTAEEPVKVTKPKPPVFVPLDPFTVNLAASTQDEQYLQVAATLKVLDQSNADTLKQYMPELRHRILTLLASKKPTELTSGEGRERLAEEMRQTSNNVILAANGNPVKPIRLDIPLETNHEAQQEAAATASEQGSVPVEADADKSTEKPAEAAETPAPAASTAAAESGGNTPATDAPTGTPVSTPANTPPAATPAKPKPATRLAHASEDDPVQNVFFTSFIIQ